ncbi:unnamed protein product [Closterium sp. NIES-53]
MRRARRTLASSTWRLIRSWRRWSSTTTTARASGGYARLHGARKPFRELSDDPRKHHLHGEGVGVGDEEADDGTLEGSELAGFEEEHARYRDEEDDEMWGDLEGQHHKLTEATSANQSSPRGRWQWSGRRACTACGGRWIRWTAMRPAGSLWTRQALRHDVKEGDFVVVPAGFPHAALAYGEGLECITMIPKSRPQAGFLAGVNSVLRMLPASVQHAAFNADEKLPGPQIRLSRLNRLSLEDAIG